MSLHIITGLPRNGKSFYCCTRIIDDLLNTDRVIYTNLPVNPDVIARVVAVRKMSKKIEYLDLFDGILLRIRVFRKFNTRKELMEFRQKNPLWCRLDISRDHSKDKSLNFSGRLLYTIEELSEYWNHTKANSIFYFDECYQIWNCLDASERSAENKERRKELQNYMRMHGHDGDDIFLISHKERDLDRFILDTCSYRINVRNSKYWPVVPQEIIDKYWWLSFLGSLRWPVQFFILRTYIGDEATHHKSFWKASNKTIFKCYDSMSRPNGLKDRGFDGNNVKSSDINRRWYVEIKEWFFDALPALIMLFLAVFTVRGIYKGIRGLLDPKDKKKLVTKAIPVSSVPAVPGVPKQEVKQQEVKQQSLVVLPRIVALTPNMVQFSNGVILRKDSYYDYQDKSLLVVSVSRDYVVFCDGAGDQKRYYRIRPENIFK